MTTFHRVVELLAKGHSRSVPEMSGMFNADPEGIRSALVKLRNKDQAHISEWKVDHRGRYNAAWSAGAGTDAPKPPPINYRERRTKEMAAFVGKTPVAVRRDPLVSLIFGERGMVKIDYSGEAK